MGAAVHRAMEGMGIDVRTGTAVTGFEAGRDRRIRSVLTGDGAIPANVVVLGLGVRPNTALAHGAGLPLGDHGGLRTKVQMQVLGHDHVWAGGDCVESARGVALPILVPLSVMADPGGNEFCVCRAVPARH